MVERGIPHSFGRRAFGSDPARYDAARPDYPEWVFATLTERCGLADGTAAFEIGPGTGKASRRLLRLGARPLVAIEPDPRSAAYLRQAAPDSALQVIVATFEDAALAESAFDLGVCATAFHWLDEASALLKVARLLRPGGWWAMMWNVFGDNIRPDPFHEATKALLDAARSPSAGVAGVPFALDGKARVAALERTGAFDCIEHHARDWSLELDPDATAALYATFSDVSARRDRRAVVAELRRIAGDAFGGRVTRNMTTSLYIARRCPSPDRRSARPRR
ncbi:MAG TPA: class I SAM-dependent methyltransferase [Stellaceae bacterium]|nr:class I SAM-dependent methyltransferase [Stellaceae bacterium]